MMRKLAAAALLAALGGCGAAATAPVAPAPPDDFSVFYAGENVTGEVSAPAVLSTGDDAAELPLRLRLRNHAGRALELSESTRCTVLRWSIIDARGDTLDAMPNRRCAQQVATRRLPPARAIARAYQIPLPAGRGRYTLRFSFWGYPGEHAFEVR